MGREREEVGKEERGKTKERVGFCPRQKEGGTTAGTDEIPSLKNLMRKRYGKKEWRKKGVTRK